MGLFSRDPTKKLKKAYQRKLEEAMQAMHRGDIRANATLTVEAEQLRTALEALTAANSNSHPTD